MSKIILTRVVFGFNNNTALAFHIFEAYLAFTHEATWCIQAFGISGTCGDTRFTFIDI